jgi:hypothetical protein
VVTQLVTADPMGKKKPPQPPDPEPAPDDSTPSQTVRLDGDLVEMARYVCFHRRQGGRRLKLTQYLDTLLRDAITKDYQEERARQAQSPT